MLGFHYLPDVHKIGTLVSYTKVNASFGTLKAKHQYSRCNAFQGQTVILSPSPLTWPVVTATFPLSGQFLR
jgi:hypothetical protein